MAKRKKKVKPTVIFYPDRISYAELAGIILEKLEGAIGESEVLGEVLIESEIDVKEFADDMENIFDSEAINELALTEFGKGLIFGAYLQWKVNLNERDEREVLEGMEF